jgi:hypothetical protein
MMFVSDSQQHICLSFIVFQAALHEATHWIVHHTHSYLDESLRYGTFFGTHICDLPTQVAKSGYLMDSKLWGGIIQWGIPYGPCDQKLFRFPTNKWHKIMVVAIQYEQHHQSKQFHIIGGCLPLFRQS